MTEPTKQEGTNQREMNQWFGKECLQFQGNGNDFRCLVDEASRLANMLRSLKTIGTLLDKAGRNNQSGRHVLIGWKFPGLCHESPAGVYQMGDVQARS